MIVYSEKKLKNQSIFTKHIFDDNGVELSNRCVKVPLYRIQQDGKIYFVLYNDKMEVISEVFEYLNFDIGDSPITTKNKTAFAIRLLFCFLELTNINVQNITEETLKELQHFLRGVGTVTEQYSLQTQRSANTINGYMAAYRSFFSKRKIISDALFRSHSIFTETKMGDDYSSNTERKRYSNNLSTGSASGYVPRYIGPNDFRKLYKLAIEKKDSTAKLLMHLMYGYGLRLGECLGLTKEDITEIKIDGKLVPVLYLRNRISDRTFQFSKGLPHVMQLRQYHTKDYNSSTAQITITYDFYEELEKSINKMHKIALDNYPENYRETLADIVSLHNKPESNHYVFLNQYGRVLSDQTWNNSLKQYFRDAGIPIDNYVRENNLNHRFRHGFAMLFARFSEHPLNILELQKMLRHRSIASTMVYYNPTQDDEFKTKTEFQEELYNLIPELKAGQLYE